MTGPFSDEVSQREVRVTGCGNGEITIKGLTEDEIERFRGSIERGMWWIKGDGNFLTYVASHESLPDPTKDESMLPFWRAATAGEKANAPKLFEFEPVKNSELPSISIQHLCGYNYSSENYRRQAENLISFGFECLRSRRDSRGEFTEIWFLPSLSSAKGELLKCIEEQRSEGVKNQLEAAMSFLGRRVEFGALDVSVQRMAMVTDPG